MTESERGSSIEKESEEGKKRDTEYESKRNIEIIIIYCNIIIKIILDISFVAELLPNELSVV